MAQIVKLKRTAISGKIPNISNLELGELAMNTYDGRIFFEKSSSEESIQEILTTNSHPYAVTGSIYLNGAVTASHFKGDGSQLTNLPTDISIAEATTVTASYDSVDDITVTHNFNSYNVLVSVYDNNRNLLIPATTSLPTVNTARVTLSDTQSGFVVVAKGGHLISGSQIADNANKLNSQAGSYYLNWNNFNNVPAGIVSGSSQLTSTFDTRYLNTDGDNVISSSAQLTSSYDTRYALSSEAGTLSGTGTTSHIAFYNSSNSFTGSENFTATQGDVYIDGAMDNNAVRIIQSGSIHVRGLLSVLGGNSTFSNTYHESIQATDNIISPTLQGYSGVYGPINATNGVVSGSSQITDLTTHKETVSGASSYVIDHNLNEEYPIVQCWNTSISQQEQAESVTSNSVNRVTVTFAGTFAGKIIIKK